MKYSLGLDIGTSSIGWAVVDLENKRIHDVGVRILKNPKTHKAAKASPNHDVPRVQLVVA